MTVIRVSQQELERLEKMVELGDGRLGLGAAATVLMKWEGRSFPSFAVRSKAEVSLAGRDWTEDAYMTEGCHMAV